MKEKLNKILINLLFLLAFIGFIYMLSGQKERAREACGYEKTGKWLSDEEYESCVESRLDYVGTTHLQ